MAATPDSAEARQWWAFSDVTRIHEGDGSANGDVSSLSEASRLGYGSVSAFSRHLEDYLPAPTAADATATSYGQPPSEVFRFTGVEDIAGTYGALEGERVDLAGGTLLIRRGDHEIDLADETFGVPLTAQMNVLWFNDDTVIAGTARALVAAAAQPSTSLLDADAFAGLTDCVGDVVGALLVSDEISLAGDVGIGVRIDEDAVRDVMCIRVDDPQTRVAAVEATITDGTDAVSGRPWAELLGDDVEVDTSGGWLRVTITNAPTPGVFQRMLSTWTLPELVGPAT